MKNVRYIDVKCKDGRVRTISIETKKFLSPKSGCFYSCKFSKICKTTKSPNIHDGGYNLYHWCCSLENDEYDFSNELFLCPTNLDKEYPELLLKNNRPVWKWKTLKEK